MPMRQRRSGGRGVMSTPAKITRPASGATVPLAMPNSVVLPAPFGPIIPRASPSASRRSSPSATTTAPKRLEIFSKARIGGIQSSAAGAAASITSTQHAFPQAATDCLSLVPGQAGIRRSQPGAGPLFFRPDARKRLGQELQFATHRNRGRGLVRGNDQVETVALALPLPGNERSLSHILDGLAGPLHGADYRFVVGGDHGIEDRLGVERLRALEHVESNLEQRVLETDRLRPRPFSGDYIGIG